MEYRLWANRMQKSYNLWFVIFVGAQPFINDISLLKHVCMIFCLFGGHREFVRGTWPQPSPRSYAPDFIASLFARVLDIFSTER